MTREEMDELAHALDARLQGTPFVLVVVPTEGDVLATANRDEVWMRMVIRKLGEKFTKEMH